MMIPAFSQRSEYVPERDDSYRFDPDTALAILAGFKHNRRVMVQGYHGTGQIDAHRAGGRAAQLAAVRINLDGHVSRIDLVGRDAIVDQGRPPGHRVPRRAAALGTAALGGARRSTSTTRVAPTSCS